LLFQYFDNQQRDSAVLELSPFCTSLLIAKHCAVALSDSSLHQRTVTPSVEGRGGGAESGVALGTTSWPPVLMDNKFNIPSTRVCVLMSG
jgi:hypothetical protein